MNGKQEKQLESKLKKQIFFSGIERFDAFICIQFYEMVVSNDLFFGPYKEISMKSWYRAYAQK